MLIKLSDRYKIYIIEAVLYILATFLLALLLYDYLLILFILNIAIAVFYYVVYPYVNEGSTIIQARYNLKVISLNDKLKVTQLLFRNPDIILLPILSVFFYQMSFKYVFSSLTENIIVLFVIALFVFITFYTSRSMIKNRKYNEIIFEDIISKTVTVYIGSDVDISKYIQRDRVSITMRGLALLLDHFIFGFVLIVSTYLYAYTDIEWLIYITPVFIVIYSIIVPMFNNDLTPIESVYDFKITYGHDLPRVFRCIFRGSLSIILIFAIVFLYKYNIYQLQDADVYDFSSVVFVNLFVVAGYFFICMFHIFYGSTNGRTIGQNLMKYDIEYKDNSKE